MSVIVSMQRMFTHSTDASLHSFNLRLLEDFIFKIHMLLDMMFDIEPLRELNILSRSWMFSVVCDQPQHIHVPDAYIKYWRI